MKEQRVWVVEIMSDGGNEVEVYRYAKDADARVREIKRQSREDEDFDTRAYSWPTHVKEPRR